MIPIAESPLATYFDDASRDAAVPDQVWFLGDAEAAEAWQATFGGGKGLHDLPSDCWVMKARWTRVGGWIEKYNGAANPDDVPRCVAHESGWPANEQLMLVQNSRNIVYLRLSEFATHWQELLAAFDDGPLLLSRESASVAFSFVPVGDILKASPDRSPD